jgi:hypothetical protein
MNKQKAANIVFLKALIRLLHESGNPELFDPGFRLTPAFAGVA